MRLRWTIAVCVFAVVCCVPVAAAPEVTVRVDLAPPTIPIARPDLVVKRISVALAPGSTYSALSVFVRVANLGNTASPRSRVVLTVASLDPGDSTTAGRVEAEVPPLAVGTSQELSLPLVRTTVSQGLMLAIVDPPAAGKPWGAIVESDLRSDRPPPGSEVNNTFGVAFALLSDGFTVYNNPAAR